MTQKLRQGSVWLADLNPRFGTEPGKTRPVLIVQNQILLDVLHPSTLIIPLTTRLVEDAEPLRLRLKARAGLEHDSDVLVDQLRALDNTRLVKGPLLQCSPEFMHRLHEALAEVLGFPGF